MRNTLKTALFGLSLVLFSAAYARGTPTEDDCSTAAVFAPQTCEDMYTISPLPDPGISQAAEIGQECKIGRWDVKNESYQSAKYSKLCSGYQEAAICRNCATGNSCC